jgi:signal transduction histidine kinase
MEGREGHWLLHYKRPDGSRMPLEECAIERCRRQRKRMMVEQDWWVRKDGSLVELTYSAVPIETPYGSGVVVAFTEVAKRRAEERAIEARAAQRRIIEAADAARHQLARDLHDGAQHCFVGAVIELQLAKQAWHTDARRGLELLEGGLAQAERGIDELRDLAAGIHPAILVNRGLGAAIEALAARQPLPVDVSVSLAERLPDAMESSTYFLVSEALTNVVKHARATCAAVRVTGDRGRLVVEVSDDGVGGVQADGSGLAGLADRVGALDGTLVVSSPPGRGTTLRAVVSLT